MLRLLLRLYPAEFRERLGNDLVETCLAQRRAAAVAGERLSGLRFALQVLPRFALDGVLERLGLFRQLVLDGRHALQLMRRSPAFCALLVFTIALGIGASTAMVTVADTVVFRPLAYPEADRLYAVHSRFGEMSFSSGSLANLRDLRAGTDVFSWVGGARDRSPALVVRGEPQRVSVVESTAGYLDQLGAEVVLGRGLDAADHESGAQPVALVSYAQWQRQWGGDREVLGDRILLDGEPVTVVGVVSPRFRDPAPVEAHVATSVWRPLREDDAEIADRGSFFLFVLARLAAGVEQEAAAAEVSRIAALLSATYPDEVKVQGHDLDLTLHALHELTVGEVARRRLLLVVGASLLLLALVWANVANLLLARGDARQGELYVRGALGASRGRIARQLLVESLAIAAVGGALGLAVGAAALRAFVALAPDEVPRLHEIGLDARAVAFAIGATLLTAAAFGLLPAWNAASGSATARVSASRHSLRTQSVLVAAEVALALVLVASSALLLASFRRLLTVDPGFDPEDLLVVEVRAPAAANEAERQREFYRELLARSLALPGVERAGLSYHVPGGPGGSWGRIFVEGRPAEDFAEEFVRINPQAGSYLETLGVSLLEGQGLRGDEDEGSPLVVVLDEAAVERFFPGASPLGQRLAFGSPASGAELRTVVGVVASTRQRSLADDPEPEIHVPYAQSHVPRLLLTLRVRPGVEPPLHELRGLLAELAPGVPIDKMLPVEEQLSESIAEHRFLAFLVTGFGGLALVLALVGTYATASYAATRQRRELGIRRALGARSESLLGRALLRVATVAGAGAVVGLAATAAVSRWLEAYLFEVEALDPRWLAVATGLLVGAALLAALGPARRAAQVDPVQVLRAE